LRYVSPQVCSAFYVVLVTLAKCSLHAGNVKFTVQNDDWISIHIIMCTILRVWFSVSRTQ
jgi:hypothetical protein